MWPSEWVSDEAATRDAYASKNNNKDNNIPDFGHTLKLGRRRRRRTTTTTPRTKKHNNKNNHKHNNNILGLWLT